MIWFEGTPDPLAPSGEERGLAGAATTEVVAEAEAVAAEEMIDWWVGGTMAVGDEWTNS